jgi:uncharacterized FlaG/YvyC family protein
VTQVGLSGAALAPTHQSNPVTPKPDAGASTDVAAHHKSEPQQTKKTSDQSGAIDEFLKNLRTATTRLRISQDEKMGVFVYQSVDPTSGEVKGQYPSEERLRELAFLAQLDSKKHDTTV